VVDADRRLNEICIFKIHPQQNLTNWKQVREFGRNRSGARMSVLRFKTTDVALLSMAHVTCEKSGRLVGDSSL